MDTISRAASRLHNKAGLLFAACFFCWVACQRNMQTPSPQSEVWSKLKFSIDQCNSQGLTKEGTSLDYEFCIPDSEQHRTEVRLADSSIRIHASRGRVGCKTGELLCIGNTFVTDYRNRLYKICQLPYVHSVEQTFWE